MRNKLIAFVLVAAIAGATAACSGAGAPSQQPSAAPATAGATAQTAAQETAASTTEQAAAAAPATTAAPSAGGRTFVLDPAQSTAHFLINEVLFGQPKLVDGVTSKVEGQVAADYANPSKVAVGPIKVDLSGLTTDSSQRTGMVQRSILETGNPANQFAVFTPAHCDGLPAQVTIGQAFTFKITGSLALHGVTKDVTFDATVTPISGTQLSGTASTKITYGDWGVQVLRLPPQVASVEDGVVLKLDFVANAQ